MRIEIPIRLSIEIAGDEARFRHFLAEKSNIPLAELNYKWLKRSFDARKKDIQVQGIILVYTGTLETEVNPTFHPKEVCDAKEVAIIGSGPAGLFAALRAIELGLKPVIFERGKDVRSRRKDLAKLNREGLVNPESNYCFGEGGAGTYSDGKLYTRSKKRGDVQRALELFVRFGADEFILADAHPHIGTNKLPGIIIAMREAILKSGGEVHFESKVTDLISEGNKISGLEINNQYIRSFDKVIVATGHSARDIFHLFISKKWKIMAKPFALGVRIEHSQSLIDQIQYHGRRSDHFLPPASYSLVTQAEGRGVYSFCMCPGGIIAPCATNKEEVVTNGWSPSRRNNPYANSGIVVSVYPEDFPNYESDPLVCLRFQQEVEHACWLAGGKNQAVPAQRLLDFIDKRKSANLPETSYKPGLVSVDLNHLLPPMISTRLRQAFIDFGKKMKGFLSNEAVLHAPESRTSSPIQIPRTETLEHPEIKGLYPCGEGAGYAGGIISAAIDGMKCIDAIAYTLTKSEQSQ